MKTYNKQIYRHRNLNSSTDGGVHDSMFEANPISGDLNMAITASNKRGLLVSARSNKIEMTAESLAILISTEAIRRFFR